jgi:hypothetical protein
VSLTHLTCNRAATAFRRPINACHFYEYCDLALGWVFKGDIPGLQSLTNTAAIV